MNFRSEDDELLFWERVLNRSEGVKKDGTPNAHSALYMVERVDGENDKILENVFFKNAPLQFLPIREEMIVSATFPTDSAFEYRRLKKICERWMNPGEEENIEMQQIFLNIIPDVLMGQVSIFFPNLLSCTFLDNERVGGGSVLMAFDLNVAQIAEDQNIDYQSISNAIDMELNLQDEADMREIEALEAENRDLQRELELVKNTDMEDGSVAGDDDLGDMTGLGDWETEAEEDDDEV